MCVCVCVGLCGRIFGSALGSFHICLYVWVGSQTNRLAVASAAAVRVLAHSLAIRFGSACVYVRVRVRVRVRVCVRACVFVQA